MKNLFPLESAIRRQLNSKLPLEKFAFWQLTCCTNRSTAERAGATRPDFQSPTGDSQGSRDNDVPLGYVPHLVPLVTCQLGRNLESIGARNMLSA